MTLDKFFKLPFYFPNKAQVNVQSRPQSTGEGPLEVDRILTDPKYLLLFAVSMLCWAFISIYAYTAGDQIAVDYANVLYHVEMRRVSVFIFDYLSEVSDVLVWDLALSLSILVVFAALCRWATKAVIYIFIALVFVVLGLCYTSLFFIIHIFGVGTPQVMILLVLTIIYALSLYVLKKTGLDMICKVIRETCKAMFAYPSTMLIVIIQFLLSIAALAYFMSIFGFLYSIRNESFHEFLKNHFDANDTQEDIDMWVEFKIIFGGSLPDNYRSVPFHIYILHAINFLCFFWMLSFISGVTRMILTSTFATWYNNKTERRSTVTTVPKSFTTILRYHLGTVAYATSLCSIVPTLKVIYEHGRDILQKIRKQPILILAWITIFFNFTSDALAMCAIHGEEFYESAKESYNLQIKNIASYLAMNTVSQVLIFLGSLIIPTVSCIFGEVYVHHHIVEYMSKENGYEIFNAISFVTLIVPIFLAFTFFITFRAASESIRLCYFEDSKFSQEGEMKLYEIQVDELKEDEY